MTIFSSRFLIINKNKNIIYNIIYTYIFIIYIIYIVYKINIKYALGR